MIRETILKETSSSLCKLEFVNYYKREFEPVSKLWVSKSSQSSGSQRQPCTLPEAAPTTSKDFWGSKIYVVCAISCYWSTQTKRLSYHRPQWRLLGNMTGEGSIITISPDIIVLQILTIDVLFSTPVVSTQSVQQFQVYENSYAIYSNSIADELQLYIGNRLKS